MANLQNISINFQKFYELWQKEKFTDTVLIANDSKNVVKCHKIILIASSQYFEELFDLLDAQNVQNTTIVLRDINHDFLMKILSYIYCGKVDLETDEISEFKRAANYLKITLPVIEMPSLKRCLEDELDISIATQMSQDTIVDEMINDFSMNSSISTVIEDDNNSDEMEILQKKNSISLSKAKNVEPILKKVKIDSFIYNSENKPEKCKFCHRMIHEKNPAYHHQRHCFSNVSRVPLRCQQCQKDFDFVMNLREHNLKVHRER